MKKKLIFVFLFFSIWNLQAQITYTIKNVKVNNVPLSSGEPIKFPAGESSVVVKFTVQFTKPNELTIGQVSHSLGTVSWSGFNPLITPETFYLGANMTGFTSHWEKTLYASDYGFDGSDYLISSITQTSGTPPLSWQSNKIYIKREPVFELVSSKNNINCGDNSPITFTVNNVYNATGSFTYMWNVGNGWTTSPTLTYSNSITLTPSSYPPTEVKVYPILNGTEYLPQLSKSIGLNSFKPNISFLGNAIFCSTGTYTVDLSGVPSNVTTNWSISANNTANIVSSTNTSVTINVYSNTGKFDLTANVVNSCGQSRTISRRFWVGVPRIYHDNDFFDADLGTPESMILCQNYLHDDNNKKTIFTNGLDLGSQWEFQSLSNNFYWSRDNNVIYFRPYQLGAISFKVRVSNSSCGWSDWVTYNMTVISCTPFNPPSMKSLSQKTYKAYPNPSNDVVYIELKDTENPPLAETRITGKLYDLMGNLKSNVQIINNQAMFSVQGLNTGIYVLRIDIDGTIESHNIAVE